MTHLELREKFIKYFEAKGHTLVASSSLLPQNDSSVLLTTAGMQQFKPYFIGQKDSLADFGSASVVSIQKCFRTIDIEETGDDSHLTFFEMMGHFSFGGYFKKEAINFAWEFLTSKDWLGIDPNRIHATYYNGDRTGVPVDTDSAEILKTLPGLIKIIPQGAEDNFWGPTGTEGPCGPNVEFYIDGVEVWNEVFNQYYANEDKTLTPLVSPGVDMGGGLERLLTGINGKLNVYEIDVFAPLMEMVSHLPERKARIIADHARGIVFLIADKIIPSNKEQGYILRRILRRLLVHIQGSNVQLESLLQAVIDIFGSVYPELTEQQDYIMTIAREEADKFARTLDSGIKELNKLTQEGNKHLSGEEAFQLFSTYGLPIDSIREHIEVDDAEFQVAFESHQDLSRAGTEKKFGGHGLSSGAEVSEEDYKHITALHTATHLLHAALREVLGNQVQQAGSDINPERTRFDFTFERKLTPEEIAKIETIVNSQIDAGFTVSKETLPIAEAISSGAIAFFKEKYPDIVDVYSITAYDGVILSRELCGGPHAESSDALNNFKITKEESSSAGVRRIKAKLDF